MGTKIRTWPYQPWTWPKRNMRRAATDFPNSMVLAARDLGSGTNRGSVPIDKIQHSNKPNRSPSVSLIQHISGGQEGGRQGRKDERDSQLVYNRIAFQPCFGRNFRPNIRPNRTRKKLQKQILRFFSRNRHFRPKIADSAESSAISAEILAVLAE